MVLGAKRGGTESFVRIVAAPFVALRIPPNWLTVIGSLLILIPAGFAAQANWLWAGVSLALVALFDAVDGTVARATNRETKFGGFLDSVMDRLADGAVLIGVGMSTDGSFRWWAVIGAGMVGQYLTSYTRARAYQAGSPPASMWNQFFERPERIIYLSLLFVATEWIRQVRPEVEVLYWGMVIYATLTLFTSLIRMVRVYNFLEQTDK